MRLHCSMLVYTHIANQQGIGKNCGGVNNCKAMKGLYYTSFLMFVALLSYSCFLTFYLLLSEIFNFFNNRLYI